MAIGDGRRRLRGLARDRSGVSAVEFALIAPALMVTLMGLFDMAYTMYAQTMLQGSLQQAARASTIEGAATTLGSIDSIVSTSVHRVIPRATLTFVRKSYTNFGDVNMPEDFTDADGDGVCDNGEAFEDANGNGTWDRDRGVAGLGGARDAVLYTVTMTYPRAFPMTSLIGLSPNVTTAAATVLRNQPYTDQKIVATVGNCT
ncbi:TadE/TadG family type IV pilus assembly protein [Novosphingobium lentum]|uniref:TadE/TadG family type IV pilus assembly protein n=1 Tax=Novosphingobium lentum TaxID=145287 RepID=UPI000829BAE2|nr:TadE family protein [Novosphingobium lentum]